MHSLSMYHYASISAAVTQGQCLFAIQGYPCVFLARGWRTKGRWSLLSPPVLRPLPISIHQGLTLMSFLPVAFLPSCQNQDLPISEPQSRLLFLHCGIYILLIVLIYICGDAPISLLVHDRQGPYQIEFLACDNNKKLPTGNWKF